MTLYISIGALVIIAIMVLICSTLWYQKWKAAKCIQNKPFQRWQVENEFRKTLIQVFGGLVVIGGIFFAYQELMIFHTSQENMKAGQIASRFSQSIKFLGEKNTTQQIGGIYALEQITKESPENYLGTVIEVLSTFVRNAEVIPEERDFDTWKAEISPEDKKVKTFYETFKKKSTVKRANDAEINALNNFYNEWKENNYKIKPETQIALTVLCRIRKKEDRKYWEKLRRINLSDANLKSADLTEANLTRANLRYVRLTNAYLLKADLTGAELFGATLTIANLKEADLTEANLQEAKFLTIKQLLTVKTLYMVKGLPPEMEKELRAKKPELFDKPF